MPQGLQVWDDQGRLTLDTSSRVGRILGTVTAGLGTYTTTDDRLTEGTPFAFFELAGDGFLFDDYAVAPGASQPVISFAGNTMTYTRTSPPAYGTAFDCTIYYGVR